MTSRSILTFVAVVAVSALTAGPAAAQSPTDHPVPGAPPGACADHSRPTAGFTRRAVRRARRRHVLRGTASDRGCGVDSVAISILRRHGKRCRHLTTRRRLGRLSKCVHRHWLPVRGTTRWSFRLPKRLPKGRYVVRTRAIDFAGNVQLPHRRRARLR